MQKNKKNLVGILACAGVIATTAITNVGNEHHSQVVQAARTSVNARSYGVDVSVYQSGSVKSTANAGAKFAIVKLCLDNRLNLKCKIVVRFSSCQYLSIFDDLGYF